MEINPGDVKAVRDRLAGTGWLATCPPDFAGALLDLGHFRQLSRGEALQHSGATVGGMWGIAEGQLISSTGMTGPNTMLTALFGPGEWGGTGPISGLPRQLDLAARTSARLLVIPQASARRLLDAHPDWWAHFARLHFHILVKFGLMAADLQTVDRRARVAAMLLNAAGLRLEGDTPVVLALSQQELGRMVNLSHYPTGKILHQFVADGLVSARYGRISIDQPDLLRAIAEGNG